MRDVELRFPLALGHALQAIVFGPAERVAFCLVSHVEVGDTTRLLVRRVVRLDDDAYDDGTAHVSWQGRAMFPIMEAAVDEGLGVVLVHAHAIGPPRLSRTDLASAHRLLPTFRARVPGRPHGSLVLVRGAAAGLIALPGDEPHETPVSVRWMGRAIVQWGTTSTTASTDEAFDRQALVVGEQSSLAGATVAVVGLSGGGGHVVQQLSHAGVGTIVGIDDDRADVQKVSRMVGIRRPDGSDKMLKTDVMDRLVTEMGSGSTFVGVVARVPDPEAVAALVSADVIVGCVDNMHARAALQELAWRQVIPYIDIGAAIRAVPDRARGSDARVTVAADVRVLIPGGFCMWCTGLLSEAALAAERDGPDASYFKGRPGEAQVVSFNGIVASQAVTEVLALLTGFAGSSIDPADLSVEGGGQRGYLKYDGVAGTTSEWSARRRPTCDRCSRDLGAGSVLWTTPVDGGRASQRAFSAPCP